MKRVNAKWPGLIILLLLLGSFKTLNAQEDEITQLILRLPPYQPSKENEASRKIDSYIYGMNLQAVISDGDNNWINFEAGDSINFKIRDHHNSPFKDANGDSVFVGNKEDFDAWIELNRQRLLQFIFGSAISEKLAGQSSAAWHAQHFFSDRVLPDAKRKNKGYIKNKVGGLLEYENFNIFLQQGEAIQGIVYLDQYFIALQGRYVKIYDYLSTHSLTAWLSFYPHITFENGYSQYKVGANLFFSGMQAFVSELGNPATVNRGIGMWASAQKDFSQFRIGVGGSILGSQSRIPSFKKNSDQILNDVINNYNERGNYWHASYGIILGVLLSENFSLNIKAAANHHFQRPQQKYNLVHSALLVSLSYLFNGYTAIDFGYRGSYGGPYSAFGLFIQGNYRW